MTVAYDDRPFWRPCDLADLLGVDVSEIYRLIENGELAHAKVGKRTVRVPGTAAAALVSGR